MQKRPNHLVTPQCQVFLELLGGFERNGVLLTNDQIRSLRKLYEIQPESNLLMEAGADRNMFREAEQDGLRIVAWLSKFVEPGEDPLKAVILMAADAGWDVSSEDYEYALEED